MLRLERIHTELPWRKMDNLTSFTLSRIPPGAVSVGQLLDFFENAPYLEEVKLCFVIPATGAQNRRLVSLACLKSMDIDDDNPFSILLDHLLIPVGAKLEIGADLLSSSIRESFSRSLDNLQNFSDFTTIKLRPNKFYPLMKFSGPNGQVNITLRTNYPTSSVLGSLGEFNTSNTKRLEIDGGEIFNGDPLYRALLPMKDLRTLTLSRCRDPDIFIGALQPATCSSEIAVCPKLEEFVPVLHPTKRSLTSRVL